MRAQLFFSFLVFHVLVAFAPAWAQETPINLIAFKYNGMSESSEIIQWEVNTPTNFNSAPTDVASILVGSSIFNPNTGDYIARVTHTDNTSGI
jgi:hypothetical protein